MTEQVELYGTLTGERSRAEPQPGAEVVQMPHRRAEPARREAQ